MTAKSELIVPKARDFGWKLKSTDSTFFEVVRNTNDQICVVQQHSLLRGVTTEMIYWWFCHFPNLKVKLIDIPGYEAQIVPAYLLWHPTDHINASLKGKLGVGDTSKVGAKIHIQEVMQFEKHGLQYPVDQELTIFYHAKDGWCMGKSIPLIGKLMVLRIRFKDCYKDGKIIGVKYHYEVVAGSHLKNFIAKRITKKIVGNFGDEFWEAWTTHNAIEVGVFENFLPALFEQRFDLNNLTYSKAMNSVPQGSENPKGFDKAFFDQRVEGYRKSTNAFDYQSNTENLIW